MYLSNLYKRLNSRIQKLKKTWKKTPEEQKWEWGVVGGRITQPFLNCTIYNRHIPSPLVKDPDWVSQNYCKIYHKILRLS